jgi:flagellar basal body-associated protein FliL
MNPKNFNFIIIIIVSVILIAGVGMSAYYFGKIQGYQNGYDIGYNEGEKAVEDEQKEMISKAAAGSEINPVENLPSANPLDNVNTNPFEDEYENPFE